MSEISYGHEKLLANVSFDEAVERITAALAAEGFGILTEIDVKATLKKKLDKDFRRYKILGACNPNLAHQALLAEPQIGLLLPCNAVVQETDAGIMVSVASPRAMFSLVGREGMEALVGDAEARLSRVMAAT
jgi:uncharacterized protein (DUF302 family)